MSKCPFPDILPFSHEPSYRKFTSSLLNEKIPSPCGISSFTSPVYFPIYSTPSYVIFHSLLLTLVSSAIGSISVFLSFSTNFCIPIFTSRKNFPPIPPTIKNKIVRVKIINILLLFFFFFSVLTFFRFIGNPQFGHFFALSLISFPHSGHFIKAICHLYNSSVNTIQIFKSFPF